jgi:ketosteroid isomerase-like protein
MRRTWSVLSLLIIAVSLVGARGTLAQSREERDVRALFDRGIAAGNSVDPKVVLPSLADYGPGGGPFYLTFTSSVASSSDVETQVRSALERLSARTLTLTSPVDLRVDKNTAWTAYTWHTDLTYKDGSRSSFDGRTTQSFVREGKSWKIAHSHDSLAAPAPLTSATRAAEAQAVIAIERNAWEALVKKQLPALANYFADDYSMFEESQAYRVRGKAEGLHRIEVWLEQTNLQNYQMLDPQVQVLGDTALLTYYFTETGLSGGKELSNSGKISTVFVKQQGAWRALHTHRSVNH